MIPGCGLAVAPLSVIDGFPSSISRPDTSQCATRTPQSGLRSTARSTTLASFGGTWRRRGIVLRPLATQRQSSTRTLFLARDRLGKKPLFYAQHAGWLAFASELQALVAHPELARQPDPTAIDAYLAFGYIPARQTIYR